RHWNAVQRTTIATAADVDFSRLRRGQGVLCTDMEIGNQITIQRVNPLQQRVHYLHWREFTRPQQRSKFSHIEKAQFSIGHDHSSLRRPEMLYEGRLSYHRIQSLLE